MRLGKMLRRLAFAAAGSGLLVGSALAQTLTLGVPAGPASLDPHASAAPADAEALKDIFDALVASGDRLQLEPALALSWKLLDPTTWEFKLRDGVKFHDGSAFTADDVRFSIERLATVAGPNASPVAHVKEAKVLDPQTVQIVTDGPRPTLPSQLTGLLIVSHRAADGVTRESASEAFESGRAAVGTGPFRFVSRNPKEELVLERFDQHWRGAAPWQRVVRKEIPDDAARIARLKAGELDLIARVPVAELPALEREPKLKLVRAETMAIFTLAFDARDSSPRVEAKNGSALPQNPFRDPKVREAVDLAIDRPALAEVAMEGLGKALNQILPPVVVGHDDKLPPMKPNLERARQLLGEAGYPDGFKARLGYTTGRWPSDRAVGMSVARMLSRIGIEPQASGQPASAFFPALARGDFSLTISVAEGIGEAQATLSALGHSAEAQKGAGALNWGGYANPELDKLIDEAATELEEGKRRKLLEEAAALFGRERPALPLVAIVAAWAMQKDKVDMPKPRSDEATLASDIVPVRK
jgi:peptide/nickel transport system substrate-binding protein